MTETLITIVDDDEAVRDSLALLLNFRGYRTRAFPRAEACLAAWQPEWRGCLLLDLRMGGMDGLALQRALAEKGNTLPIVFLTGHGDLAHARAAPHLEQMAGYRAAARALHPDKAIRVALVFGDGRVHWVEGDVYMGHDSGQAMKPTP